MIEARTIIEEAMTRYETLAVGASGGPDSQALVHLVCACVPRDRVVLLHMNHGLREEADRDEALVRAEGERLGVRVVVRTVDVAALARETGKGLEEAGRDARCAFFLDFLAEHEKSAIFLAHHRKDQAETVLMHALRGSGVRGLTGMQTERGRFIRPFLNLPREEIFRYLEANAIPYEIDATNETDLFLRGRMRTVLEPALRRVFPEWERALARLGENARDADDFLVEELGKLYDAGAWHPDGRVFSRTEFLARSDAARRLFLHHALVRLGMKNMTRDAIECASRAIAEKKRFEHGMWITESTDELFYLGGSYAFPPYEIPVADGVKIPYTRLILHTQMGSIKRGHLIDGLVIRNRRPGDQFSPAGLGGTKKLKDVMIDDKIPVWERDRVPLLARGDEILWIVGHRISSHIRSLEEYGLEATDEGSTR